MDTERLLKKYDVPVPRYTSYPTVPYWTFREGHTQLWREAVKARFLDEQGEIALYIHLPFCEELCTYCACNKRITRNHAVEGPYMAAVLKEWQMYRDLFPGIPVIRELHLGGGTPTFFSPGHLQELISGILEGCEVSADHVFSIEVHPNHTEQEHLRVLRELGFTRISVGVQDFDTKVQFLINRMQSFERTMRVVEQARDLGFSSINIDLVYGLPGQDVSCVEATINKVGLMKPDRVAFYSYAHVPWKSKGQRRYDDEDVPKADAKLAMFMCGKMMLEAMGYESIGMDHFALHDDSLHRAFREGRLHRNFMGYTHHPSHLLIGLGASSISDSWTMFSQNEKSVEAYQERIAAGELPLVNGHILSEDDLHRRGQILSLMCQGELSLTLEDMQAMRGVLQGAIDDGLIVIESNRVIVLPVGRGFVRNICSLFDAFYSGSKERLFSKAI